MIDIDKGVYYGLDAVATDVWERLAEDVAPGQLIAELSSAYAGDPDVIARDVLVLLGRLYDQGLISTAPTAAG